MPPIDPETLAIIQFLLAQQGMGGSIMPSVDDSGVPNAPSLSDQKNQFDVLYDMQRSMFDPQRVGMLSNDVSPEAFQPTVEMEEVQRPAHRRLQQALMSDPNSIEYLVAAELLGGGTPMTAYTHINEIVSGTPESEEELQAQQNILAQISRPTEDRFGNQTGAAPDLSIVEDMANKLYEGMADDPVGNHIETRVDEDGNEFQVHFNRTETPSEMAEMYRSAGRPLPPQAGGPEYQGRNFTNPVFQEQQDRLQSGVGTNPLAMPSDLMAMTAQREALERGLGRLGPKPAPLSDLGIGGSAQGAAIGPGASLIGASATLKPRDSQIPEGFMHDLNAQTMFPNAEQGLNAGNERRRSRDVQYHLPSTPGPANHRVSVLDAMKDRMVGTQNQARTDIGREANQLKARIASEQRRRAAARKSAYGYDATRDRMFARVDAAKARREGRNPSNDWAANQMAMIRALGIQV